MREPVYSVHVTRPDDIGAVEIVFTTEREARAYANDRSTDWRILAASVTRFVVGELGSRHPVAWFVDGREQPQRGVRPGRLYPVSSADGPDADLGDGSANPAGGPR
jgi:hypothetical protein